MSKFAEVDHLILMHIKEMGSASYGDLCNYRPLLQEAAVCAKPDRWGSQDGGRVIDRRLQSLRKSGAIKLKVRKWVIA